jgi:hypothetical protein
MVHLEVDGLFTSFYQSEVGLRSDPPSNFSAILSPKYAHAKSLNQGKMEKHTVEKVTQEC